MSARALRIGLLALAGLLVAAALGVAASRITSEHVGLYGQPPSVGRELVSGPVQSSGNGAGHNGAHGRRDQDEAAGTGAKKGAAVPVVEPPPPPVDDDSTVETEEAEQAEDTEPHPPGAAEGDSDDD